MDSGRYIVLVVILTLVSGSFSQAIIQLFPKTHHSNNADDGDDNLYCDSWKFNVETNNAGKWYSIPKRCVDYVEEYMTGDRYRLDSEMLSDYSVEYLKTLNLTGKDAWIFDIDDTLFSSVPYYIERGFGTSYNQTAVNDWVDLAKAPALPATLRLYKEVQEKGVKIIVLSGRDEAQRNVSVKNLLFAGYTHWEKLLLRAPSDKGKPVTTYKSEKRKELEDEGYTIHGISGDQWSDLLGFSTGKRSFKLPNLLYYAA